LEAFEDLAKHWGDNKTFFAKLRGKFEEAEIVLKESGRATTEVDAAWDNENLREGLREALKDAVVEPEESP
jgi:hypothetical protein